jgi:Short C-terminal domain
MPLFGSMRRMSRRTARRTARRTTRRQMAMSGGDQYESDEMAEGGDEGDYTDEIAELGKLHEQGILTDEEFAAKKKEILGL